MAGDWLKLHRKLKKSEVFADADLLRAWIWCLMEAAWKPTVAHGVSLGPGQFLTTRAEVSQSLGIHDSHWRRIVNKLVQLGNITVDSDKKTGTIITICNWETYQSCEALKKNESSKDQPNDEKSTNDSTNDSTNKPTNDLEPEATVKIEVSEENKSSIDHQNDQRFDQQTDQPKGEKSTNVPYIHEEEFNTEEEKEDTPSEPPKPDQPTETVTLEQSFELFWKQYPRRVAKKDALKAWRKLKPSSDLLNIILTDLEVRPTTEVWRDRQFIPYPATYLNGQRWEDELPQQQARSPSKPQFQTARERDRERTGNILNNLLRDVENAGTEQNSQRPSVAEPGEPSTARPVCGAIAD